MIKTSGKVIAKKVNRNETFERRHYRIRKSTPRAILKELMAANRLKQSDLLPVFGSLPKHDASFSIL
jgi:antitoxin component HigA of HigAB toxin-antitoxin module